MFSRVVTDAPLTDTDVIDRIATLLGTCGEWSSAADFLDDIASLIATVRPHPGEGSPAEYAERFKQTTGRPVVAAWVVSAWRRHQRRD